MKIFERIKRKYTNGDPSSEEKTGIQKKRIPYGYTFYPVLWKGEAYAVDFIWSRDGIVSGYVRVHICQYIEKKIILYGHSGKRLFNAGKIHFKSVINPSVSFHNISYNQMLLALYPDIIKKAFAEYEKRLSEQTLQNEMEKKAAEWGGVIDAVQDSSSRRERLEKRLIYLKDYLQKYDGVSEQIYNSFSKEITEIEEELGKLGG